MKIRAHKVVPAYKEKGKVFGFMCHEEDWPTLTALLDKFKNGKLLSIDIKEWKSKRTLKQNNFEHLLYEKIVQKIAYENHENPNYIIEILRMNYVPSEEEVKAVIKEDGGPWIMIGDKRCAKPSSSLNVEESSHRIEHAFIMATTEWGLDMSDVIKEWEEIKSRESKQKDNRVSQKASVV